MYKFRNPHKPLVYKTVPRKLQTVEDSGVVFNQYGHPLSDFSKLMQQGGFVSASSVLGVPHQDQSLGRTDSEKCEFVKSRYMQLPNEVARYEDSLLQNFASKLPQPDAADSNPNVSPTEGAE